MESLQLNSVRHYCNKCGAVKFSARVCTECETASDLPMVDINKFKELLKSGVYEKSKVKIIDKNSQSSFKFLFMTGTVLVILAAVTFGCLYAAITYYSNNVTHMSD
jgi:ribosomal protein L32